VKISELNEEQRLQLKQDVVFRRCQDGDRFPYWSELADAGETVSDEDLEEAFGDVDFVPEDFWGTSEDEDGEAQP